MNVTFRLSGNIYFLLKVDELVGNLLLLFLILSMKIKLKQNTLLYIATLRI